MSNLVMDDLSQLIESALEENHATLRKAAMGTIASMGPEARVRDLLKCEAAPTIRSLSLRELAQALQEARGARPRRRVAGTAADLRRAKDKTPADTSSESTDIFHSISSLLAAGPQTIGQLGRELGLETPELRTYLQWMLKDGRLTRSGKARATRYHLA